MKALVFSPPPPFLTPNLTTFPTTPSLHLIPSLTFPSLKLNSNRFPTPPRPDFKVRADDGDADGGGDDYDMDEEEAEEVDNKKDYDVEYEPLASTMAAADGGGDEDIAVVQSKSFVSTQGWDSETIVNYRINEDEFHKLSLLDCDFFIRKPADPDNDVYDFREMYVTPPDTDIYSIPKVLAPMPQKFFLTKHYRNRRLGDPEFVLDFEEIYVIDSKTKSITRAKVLVTVPEGRNRDRKKDLLVIRDNGNSFKIIPMSERDDATTVIEREEWNKSRQDMERHLSKLRDFSVSNWF
ncbi:uncharacterized protein LOC114280198 isoform X2 [Camellia sinensis]|uniref:uncharacterized protein LOC114280198 isoform X2 n=1 Tax=Camellia sinensis TaxID=4442 RepID=UPI001035B2E6|nr:uncharacterized protein LOC114280198 isoform X2 [Camellia sinensis]